MSELQIFNYHDTPLRTVEKDGELWWVLKDVCEVIGIAKHTNVAARLEDDEKGACLMGTPSGQQSMIIINEPGLYSVILRSDKPEAKDFKRWVTHEVIPSIRRTGSYSVPAPRAQQADSGPARPVRQARTGGGAVKSNTYKRFPLSLRACDSGNLLYVEI